jgi:hypothetical protein
MEPDETTDKKRGRGRLKLPPGHAKVRRCIAIDAAVWERALEVFPSVSAEIERGLKRAIKREGRKGNASV